MNTDFRLSVGYFEHPKVLKLERRLGEGAVLAHIRLLRFATMNKPDGILSGMDSEDIAIAAGYKGDPDPFITLLLTLRLIDQEDGEYSLHDWAEWNPWAAGSKSRTAKASKIEQSRLLWNAMRKAVSPVIFRRDGYTCHYCGSKKRLTVDHVLPISRGGDHNHSNLLTACRSCNCRKGTKTPDEWNLWLEVTE